MTMSRRTPPPLSPVLLAGLAARPLPPRLLQPLLDVAMRGVRSRHPDLFDRLSGLNDPVYLIDPVDLPFVFVLRPNPANPTLRALRSGDGVPADAVIRGPFLRLIDLLEGRIDGDALFFTRELTVEGDTEAVVALRNAVDGAEISVVDDILALFGPLGRPLRLATGAAAGVFGRLTEDLEILRAALVAPVAKRAEANASGLKELDERLTDLRRRTPAGPPRRAVPRKPRVEGDA